MTPNPPQLIETSQARCRDCYRCLRVCPVKAIRLKDGQASVDATLCIGCGSCIRNCPQQAKRYRQELDAVEAMVREGETIAVSLAPSYRAVMSRWGTARLAAALRRCGVNYVAETAWGAQLAAQESMKYCQGHRDRSVVLAACPAVVNLIEKYRPELTERIAPVASPMICHGRYLKERLGAETKVVFIGPCVAKKEEAQREDYRGIIDAVLTFEEMGQWFEREGVELANCEEAELDQYGPEPANAYPLPGGALSCADMGSDLLARNHVAVSGAEDLLAALDSIDRLDEPMVLEALFCRHGCIDGPATGCEATMLERRVRVLNEGVSHRNEPMPEDGGGYGESRFRAARLEQGELITEDAIRAVLEQTGKTGPEEELNCGACGYGSCREKAAAVIRGMAELEMCIPYMRYLAERRTDRIIETSPNGIVILDKDLAVISMNPSFREMFMCTPAFIGRRISDLIDPEPFERLLSGENRVESIQRYESYHLVCQQIAYTMPDEEQYVGIFVNITAHRQNQKKLDSLRAQTVLQAQDLLKHQFEMAQQLAVFLGESTARGELLVENLMALTEDENGSGGRKANLWDIYTSR